MLGCVTCKVRSRVIVGLTLKIKKNVKFDKIDHSDVCPKCYKHHVVLLVQSSGKTGQFCRQKVQWKKAVKKWSRSLLLLNVLDLNTNQIHLASYKLECSKPKKNVTSFLQRDSYVDHRSNDKQEKLDESNDKQEKLDESNQNLNCRTSEVLLGHQGQLVHRLKKCVETGSTMTIPGKNSLSLKWVR